MPRSCTEPRILPINDSEIQTLPLINNATSQSIDQHSAPNASYKHLTCSVR